MAEMYVQGVSTRKVKAITEELCHEYPDGTLALFHGPRRLAGYTADGA